MIPILNLKRLAFAMISMFVLLILACLKALASDPPFSVKIARFIQPVELSPADSVTFNILVEFDSDLPENNHKVVLDYLKNPSHYTFVKDWHGTDNAVETAFSREAFRLSAPIESAKIGTLPKYKIILKGQAKPYTRGEAHIALPPASENWKVASDNVEGDHVVVRYVNGKDWSLPAFQPKIDLGVSEGIWAVDFSASGVIDGRRSQNRTRITTLSIAGKLPLYTPDDVRKTPGSSRDASRQLSDLLEFSLNSVGYRRGGNLDRYGLKLRATGSLRGVEAVGYYSPLSTPLPNALGYAATELEVGYRSGNAEFTNLVTRASNPGNVVGRLGVLLELTPRIEPLGINRNLSKGLRFFVRVRGWLDTFQGVSNDTGVRLRVFADTELFYNFTPNSRVFLRGETGYLPPDLAKPSERVYIGVGAAF